MSLQDDILERIKKASIDCPDCEYQNEDDQYTCVTCWCVGGNGKLNVFEYIKEHKSVLST